LEAHTSALEENKGLKMAVKSLTEAGLNKFSNGELISELIKRFLGKRR